MFGPPFCLTTHLCTMQHATRNMQHATCNTQHATCNMQHATMQQCNMQHASRTFQLRTVQNGLIAPESHQDSVRTPRRRNYRDRDQARFASGSGRHRPSRSRSPTRRTPHTSAQQRPSPPPYQSPSKNSGFQPSTASQGQPVCALCLAIDPHDSRKCRSENLWDGSKARCRKNDEGRLITPAGTTLCSDWNSRRGCTTSTHEQRHECSGCGNKEHGAQRCPRAQKKSGAHPL